MRQNKGRLFKGSNFNRIRLSFSMSDKEEEIERHFKSGSLLNSPKRTFDWFQFLTNPHYSHPT